MSDLSCEIFTPCNLPSLLIEVVIAPRIARASPRAMQAIHFGTRPYNMADIDELMESSDVCGESKQ